MYYTYLKTFFLLDGKEVHSKTRVISITNESESVTIKNDSDNYGIPKFNTHGCMSAFLREVHVFLGVIMSAILPLVEPSSMLSQVPEQLHQ